MKTDNDNNYRPLDPGGPYSDLPIPFVDQYSTDEGKTWHLCKVSIFQVGYIYRRKKDKLQEQEP